MEQLLRRDNKPTDYVYPQLPRAIALVAHEVSTYLGMNLTVHHQPLFTNYYHGGVAGDFTRGHRRRLANDAVMIVPIDEALAEQYANPVVT